MLSFETGEVIAERYRIKGKIGKGGMGMVYMVRDITTVVGAEMEPQKRPKSPNLYRHSAISIDSWVRGNIDVILRPLFAGVLCFSIKG